MHVCVLAACEKVGARYGKAIALSDVSFTLEQGEILAILGPNGSGKTTLFRVLLGLVPASAGKVTVVGLDQIGATIELPSLYGHLSAMENLEITAHLKRASTDELPLLLEDVGLAHACGVPVAQLSLGMRQRLAIAEALIGTPKLLILDEPTNGLDPEGIRWFREWVVRAAKRRGLGVILSSHILSEVAQVAQRLLVLNRGRERFSGTVDELCGRPALRVRVRKREAAEAILRQEEIAFEVATDALLVDVEADRAPEIARRLIGTELLELTPIEQNLEERYLALFSESAVMS